MMATARRVPKKVLIVSSVGGHLTEVMQVRAALEGHRVYLVVNDEVQLPDFPFEAVYRIAHAERDWRVVWNLVEAAVILDEVRPDVILSTGAGPVVPFALLGRAIPGLRVVFIESAAAVERPTLTGRIMRRLAHDLFYPWESLARYFPRGRLLNVVFP